MNTEQRFLIYEVTPAALFIFPCHRMMLFLFGVHQHDKPFIGFGTI